MLPRLEEAEGAARMVKVFREDLEVSIGEITSSRIHNLEDPHLVIIDEGASTFGPTWANLFELARKGRFSLLFGAQSTGGLSDKSLGLSEAFYERVMANVNLKVMMRVGDNRTAKDLSNWMGKVETTATTVGTSVSRGKMSDMFSGVFDLAARRTGGESHTIHVSQDEKELVSAEELKHEMSSEKGLAWFDLGRGTIVKGRSLWIDAEIPERWDGRDHVVRMERTENDDLGLAEWVDEQILLLEKTEEGQEDPDVAQPLPTTAYTQTESTMAASDVKPSASEERPASSNRPFKLIPTKRGRRKQARFFVSESTAETKTAAASPGESSTGGDTASSKKPTKRKNIL